MMKMGLYKEFKTILKSNESCNTLGQKLDNVINSLRKTADMRIDRSKYLNKKYGTRTKKIMSDGEEAMETISTSDWDRVKSLYSHSDGSANLGMYAGTIAGGYMGLSAAGRIATGGGLYRDSDGNFDIIGIPIV